MFNYAKILSAKIYFLLSENITMFFYLVLFEVELKFIKIWWTLIQTRINRVNHYGLALIVFFNWTENNTFFFKIHYWIYRSIL